MPKYAHSLHHLLNRTTSPGVFDDIDVYSRYTWRMPRTTLFVHAGQRIGRGVVIDPEVTIPRARQGGGKTVLRGARLICDCGNEYVSALQALVGKRPENQRSLSCGCLRRERQIAAVTGHGMSRRQGPGPHPLVKTGEGMIRRCEQPSASGYENYGGRGIAVCPEWHDVRNFIAWIEANLGPRPGGLTAGGAPEYSLDRWPDLNGNYEPGNVRWATWIEQAANRRPMAPRESTGRGARGADPRPYARTCEQCGEPFQAARPSTMFCSKACKARHRRAARKDDIAMTCHQCGGTYTANRYDGIRHCGQACAATCQHAGDCPAKAA